MEAFFLPDSLELEFFNEVVVLTGEKMGVRIQGVFDVNFFDQTLGSMRVSAENSQFYGNEKDLSGLKAGDEISISGKNYKIQAVMNDFAGMALLDLKETFPYEKIPYEEPKSPDYSEDF